MRKLTMNERGVLGAVKFLPGQPDYAILRFAGIPPSDPDYQTIIPRLVRRRLLVKGLPNWFISPAGDAAYVAALNEPE